MENKKEKKSGSKIKIISIILVALIVVGASGYFGYSMFLKDKGAKKTKTTTTQQQIAAQQGTVPQAAINSNYLDQVVSAKTFELGEFLVNLADEDGKRYLKVTVYLGYDDKKLDAELETKKAIIRDGVISVLRTKKAADIIPKNMNNIKLEIIQRINPMLEEKNGQLSNVYFYDVLVQ